MDLSRAPPPAPKFTRGSRACRRCRRLRIKCRNTGQLPCEGCMQANEPCSFPRRGEPDHDRAYRRPRQSQTESRVDERRIPAPAPGPASAPRAPPTPASTPPDALWALLPPYDEVVEGIHILTTSFFQLGFLPKMLFFERLKREPTSISVFLLLGILSVSARFTPSLVKRYNGGSNATEVVLGRAATLVPQQMFTPTLEVIQGFFLISIAEWGKGDKHRSSMYMGIAIRMAGFLRLHREETYRLPASATAEEAVDAEAARRTFWMLETFENLHSGSSSPVTFSYRVITALLPCDERDFAFGVIVQNRAALVGTPPAIQSPSLTCSPSRSLFATLLQTHNLWGQVARVVNSEQENASRIDPGEYERLSMALRDFDQYLPMAHRWSLWNLRGFKAEGLDLAFFSAVMTLQLSNIILRRSYLQDGLATQQRTNMTAPMTTELFDNVLVLHEQIKAFLQFRDPDQGFPALIVFCTYVCGSLAYHLYQRPHICPSVAPHAQEVLNMSIKGLGDLQHAWPRAREWNTALCKAMGVPGDESDTMTQDDPVENGYVDVQAETQTFQSPPGLRFNDPLPSDTIFETFEMYSWSDVFSFGA